MPRGSRVLIRCPPHWLHLSGRPASGTNVVSGNPSTVTSALCAQASHFAITARTPLRRMGIAIVVGGAVVLLHQIERIAQLLGWGAAGKTLLVALIGPPIGLALLYLLPRS